MDIKTITISRSSDIAKSLREFYSSPGPVFCNVEINPDQKLYPVLKFGFPLENQMPTIATQLIDSEMIIPPFQETDGRPALVATAGV